jgi:hypothetical protein
MKQQKIRVALFLSILFVAFSACKSDYQKLVQNELDSGVKYDSLFLGIQFGQTRKEFFDRAWQLNKSMGLQPTNGNLLVFELIPQTEELSPIQMHFYPTFDKDERINGMDLKFSYSRWNIFNDRHSSDRLVQPIIDTLQNWYGRNPFMKLTFEKEPNEIWVKVDGNRRMAIRKEDDRFLEMKITNLLDKEEDVKNN